MFGSDKGSQPLLNASYSKQCPCHPAVRNQVVTGTIIDDPVVKDGNIITSQGPGTTFMFALELIKTIDGPDAAQIVSDGLILL